MTAPVMKTLRVSLVDLGLVPVGPGNRLYGNVWARLTSQVRTTDGLLIVLSPAVKELPSTGIVDFSVPANDDTGIVAGDRGFGVTVGWDLVITGTTGTVSNTGTTVLITGADSSVVAFTSKAPAVAAGVYSEFATDAEVLIATHKVARTNLCTNPNFEISTTGWGIYPSGSLTRDTAYSFAGTASMRMDTTTAMTFTFSAQFPAVAQVEYAASVYVRGSGSAQAYLVDYPNNSGIGSSPVVVLSSDWQRVTIRGTTSSNATAVGIQVFQVTAGALSMWIDSALIEQSSSATPYFDGSTATSGDFTYAWTGTTGASTSTETATAVSLGKSIVPTLNVPAFTYPLSGVGFPENVFAAPVGTRYVDSAATCGAVEWIKATGAGNTGWKVVYGDTGWRNISSLLINGWTGTFKVRRVNSLITYSTDYTGLSHTSATAGNFFAPNGVDAGFYIHSNGAVGTEQFFPCLKAGNLTYMYWYQTSAGLVDGTFTSDIKFQVSILTDRTWPTVLPGT